MHFRQFSHINAARCVSKEGFNHDIQDWDLSDWFLATLGELGEAANVAKKLNRERDGIKGNKETVQELEVKLAKEIADTFIYLDLLCQYAQLDLQTIVAQTFNAKSDEIGSDIKIPVEVYR